MDRTAAIWARVSTEAQTETSLESQILRAKARLEDAGYVVLPERILSVDWSSLDLFSCPEFQKLRQWVGLKEIQALGILDRDRLEAQGLQRLTFLSACKEAGVELVVCQGPPILNEPEGQLVELALAIGKERSVMRAKQGSKDGLHDRVVIKRLPATQHKVFGYKWDGDRRLAPDDNWEEVKLIFDMALAGQTYFPIIKELGRRGVLSPGGVEEWPKATISSILHNPVYAGRYYGLRKEAITPLKRNGVTYGNSSQRKLPFEQWVELPEIEIVSPPITWEQRQKILNQLEQHQKLAQRNAKRDYLLRGLIFCDEHRGKKGEPRRYHGRPHDDICQYVCPIGGCCHPCLNGPKIEELAKLHTKFLIGLQPDEFYERISDKRNRDELEQSLYRELRSLETKYNRNINTETELEHRNILGLENSDVYHRLKARCQAERKWIENRRQAIGEELAQLNRQAEAAASLMEVQAKVRNRLSELTNAEWRELFAALNLEIHARDDATITIWPADWDEEIPKEVVGLEICFGLPLERDTERVGEIMLNLPEHD
jgi:DNA invertase Pin-like site-specific DNA recombinase